MLNSDQSKHCIRGHFHGYWKIFSHDSIHAWCEIANSESSFTLYKLLTLILLNWRNVRLGKESVVKKEKTAGECRENARERVRVYTQNRRTSSETSLIDIQQQNTQVDHSVVESNVQDSHSNIPSTSGAVVPINPGPISLQSLAWKRK